MDLIVKSDGKDEPSTINKSSNKPKFPDSGDIFSTDVPAHHVSPRVSTEPTKAVNNQQLEEIVAVYERHFDALNKDGYDFYEFHEAMSGLTPKSPDAYKMALHFAKQMGGDVNKVGLVQMADFYIGELNKLHDHNDQQGHLKLSEMNVNKKAEKSELESDITSLESQIASLRGRVAEKKVELNSIDSRYGTQISSVEEKLRTNTVARDAVIGSINEIKSGIEKHVN